jgi:hypothetical protein
MRDEGTNRIVKSPQDAEKAQSTEERLVPGCHPSVFSW